MHTRQEGITTHRKIVKALEARGVPFVESDEVDFDTNEVIGIFLRILPSNTGISGILHFDKRPRCR